MPHICGQPSIWHLSHVQSTNAGENDFPPPQALRYRATMMTVLLSDIIFGGRREVHFELMYDLWNARNMLHCTWKRGLHHSLVKSIWGALRAERRSPLLGQAASMSCWYSGPWNQFQESKRPVTWRGLERPQEMPLQCLKAAPRGVSVLTRYHLGQRTHVFSKTNRAPFFHKNLISHYCRLCRATASFSSSFALM